MLCTLYSWIHLRWISSLCGCLSILFGCMLISFSSWTVRFHCKVSTVNLMYRSITIIHCAVKPVLNGRTRGIAYWPFNTSLTSLIVTQENDDQRAKYLSHDKLTWKCLCLFLCEKKGIKDHWMLCTVYLLHWYGTLCILSKWLFNKVENKTKLSLGPGKRWPSPLNTAYF